MNRNLIVLFVFSFLSISAFAHGDHDHDSHNNNNIPHVVEDVDHSNQTTETHDDHDHVGDHHGEDEAYNPSPMIMHHIADANEWHLVGNVTIPLPVILYSKETGLIFKMSSKFHHGETAIDGFVMDHNRIKKVTDPGFPKGEVHLDVHKTKTKSSTHYHYLYQGKELKLERKGFLDFSITKNVATMLIAAILMFVIFLAVAKRYKERKGQAPKGLQAFIEPIIVFVDEEIASPNLHGKHKERFMPYLLCVFFFIWILNLLGLIPLIGGPNASGNIALTAAVTLFTFVLIHVFANRHYWQHIFWMPGVPVPMKIFLAPIELLGVFTKPFALLIRLFANITAGHILMLSLVCLVFVFGNAGDSVTGSVVGSVIAVPLALFISLIELLVAALQAFIFTMLSAVFIGMATDDHH